MTLEQGAESSLTLGDNEEAGGEAGGRETGTGNSLS